MKKRMPNVKKVRKKLESVQSVQNKKANIKKLA